MELPLTLKIKSKMKLASHCPRQFRKIVILSFTVFRVYLCFKISIRAGDKEGANPKARKLEPKGGAAEGNKHTYGK